MVGHIFTTLLLILALGFHGCAERRNPQDVPIQAHPDSWNESASADFHGTNVLGSGNAETCSTCHGSDLRGQPGRVGCYECHDGAGGHPFGYRLRATSSFHGLDVAREGPTACKTCHGQDQPGTDFDESYRGGWSSVSCFECHAGGPSGHPDGWMVPISASFHGRRATEEGFDDCRRCHGNDLQGGTSEVACSLCHG